MILLLGGGYILTKLAKKIDASNFVITSRKEDKIEYFKSLGFSSLKFDLGDKFPISKIDIVIDSVPPVEDQILKLEKLYNQISPKRVIYLSTTGVFGFKNGEIVDEDSECHPLHKAGRLRLEVENFYKKQNFETISVRIPAIYGQGRGIGNSLKNKTMPLIDGGNRYSNRIHSDDLVEIIARIIALESVPEVLCINDEDSALIKDVVEFYCNNFNIPFPEEIDNKEALKRGYYHFLSNQRINNSKLKEILDYKFIYPSYRLGAKTEFESN